MQRRDTEKRVLTWSSQSWGWWGWRWWRRHNPPQGLWPLTSRQNLRHLWVLARGMHRSPGGPPPWVPAPWCSWRRCNTGVRATGLSRPRTARIHRTPSALSRSPCACTTTPSAWRPPESLRATRDEPCAYRSSSTLAQWRTATTATMQLNRRQRFQSKCHQTRDFESGHKRKRDLTDMYIYPNQAVLLRMIIFFFFDLIFWQTHNRLILTSESSHLMYANVETNQKREKNLIKERCYKKFKFSYLCFFFFLDQSMSFSRRFVSFPTVPEWSRRNYRGSHPNSTLGQSMAG